MSRRALVVDRPGEIALVERAELEPGPGEVVLRPAFCGVCGTDLELLDGDLDPAYVRYPVTIGHEWSGVVEAVGPGVEGVEAGDRCVAEGIVPCGDCSNCRAGATNTCDVYDEIGFTREGGASDQVLVPARLVHRLADEVALEGAALVEPSSVVLRALQKANPLAGARVVVIGDGTIALLAAHLIGLWSPAEVVVVGRRSDQAELAVQSGATRFTVDDGEARDADLAIEAAGAVDGGRSRRSARRAAAGRSRSSVCRRPAEPSSCRRTAGEQRPHARRELQLHHGGVGRVVGLLNEGRISPGAIVTHRFPSTTTGGRSGSCARRRGREGKSCSRSRERSHVEDGSRDLIDRLWRLHPAVVSDCLDKVGIRDHVMAPRIRPLDPGVEARGPRAYGAVRPQWTRCRPIRPTGTAASSRPSIRWARAT